MGGREELWRRAYTTYQRDPRIVEEWLALIKEDPIGSLDTARRLTVAEVKPDTLTLGFSPQVLVAVLAVNYPRPVKVVTSPEVARGAHLAARHSHEVLKLYASLGLIDKVVEAPMAPTASLTPRDVVSALRRALREAEPRVLDISGGTQLAALAASTLSIKLSYTYPHGDRVRIYLID